MLATDFVSNTEDSGPGSLRYTIGNANPGDIIAFANGVTGTITLTSGPLDITQDLDIKGPGADGLTISGNDASEVFSVVPGVTATISELIIANGVSTSLSGGGIDNYGTAIIANTIIATNTAPTGPDVDGTVTSLGYNLIGNPSGGSGFAWTDLLNVSPLLGPLQYNGGPTATMALLPGSLAIAAGNVALIPPGITTDQRGSARIVNGNVDIGAFESRGFLTTVTSGNNQQTAVSAAFGAPLVVTVSRPYGEPVAGGVVTFLAPTSGASATFAGGSNTASIDAAGQASIAVAANSKPGSYTVSAVARRALGASFELTNTPGIPTQLVIHTQPSATATAGQAFATQPVIYEEDQYGNLETGDNSTKVTASLRTGTGPLQGTTTVTVSGGVATFTNLADDTAETIILLFTSPALAKATSNPITISSDPPRRMIRTVQTKLKEPSRAKNGHAIRNSGLHSTAKAHTHVELTRRQRPLHSSAVPDGEAKWIDDVSTANRDSAVVRADSAPVRVPAKLKASLVAYLIAVRYGDPDLN